MTVREQLEELLNQKPELSEDRYKSQRRLFSRRIIYMQELIHMGLGDKEANSPEVREASEKISARFNNTLDKNAAKDEIFGNWYDKLSENEQEQIWLAPETMLERFKTENAKPIGSEDYYNVNINKVAGNTVKDLQQIKMGEVQKFTLEGNQPAAADAACEVIVFQHLIDMGMGDRPFNDDEVYNEFDKKRNELVEYNAFRFWYMNDASQMEKGMIVTAPGMAAIAAFAGVKNVHDREYSKAHPIEDDMSEGSDEKEKDNIININALDSIIEEDEGIRFTSDEEYEELAKQSRYAIADKFSEDDMPSFYDWKSKYPKEPPKNYDSELERSKYNERELKGFDKIWRMKNTTNDIGLVKYGIDMGGNKTNNKFCEDLSNALGRMKNVFVTGEELESRKDAEKKYNIGMATVKEFAEIFSNSNSFKRAMDSLTTESRKSFVKLARNLNEFCKTDIPVDDLLMETGYGKLSNTGKQTAANTNAFAAKGYGAIDSRDLKNDLTSWGIVNWGSSAEHADMVNKYNAYTEYMRNAEKIEEAKKNELLDELRRSAENYVVLKRGDRWNENPNWRPTQTSGRDRFDAAMAIIDMSRKILGMDDFTVQDSLDLKREIDKEKYKPANNDELRSHLLDGRRDQFVVENDFYNKESTAYCTNEIKKLLNEGKPKTKGGFDELKEDISEQMSLMIAYKTNETSTKKVTGDDIKETKSFKTMMAQAKDWKSLVNLSLKATLGTGNQFFADYNKINKAELEKQAKVKHKGNEITKERESLASIK